MVIDAVLFDMDGTLVDSTPEVERLWRAWARRVGIDESALLATIHGVPTPATIQRFTPERNLVTELAWFHDAERNWVHASLPIAGAVEFVRSLDVPWAVVTAADSELARQRLTSASHALPRVLIGSERVSNGKPFPDGYLLAARELGVDPARCVVFEDSPTGILAARRAGVGRVIGLATTHARAALLADEVIADFRDYGSPPWNSCSVA